MLFKFLSIKKERPLLGLFVGTVKDNNDPEKLSRVKISIKGLTSDLNTSKLPWYSLKLPIGMGGSANSAHFCVPEIDSNVTVMFPDEDIYNGVVDGFLVNYNTTINNKDNVVIADEEVSTKSISDNVSQLDLSPNVLDDYPNSYGFLDSIKNWFKINKTKKSAEFVHSSNSFFKINEDGDCTLNITGNMKFIVQKDLTIESQNLSLISNKAMVIDVINDLGINVGGSINENVIQDFTSKVTGAITINTSSTMDVSTTSVYTGTSSVINLN